jgi:hypothetical protein
MEYTPTNHFDLVLCLQVLEHVEDPAAFASKLFRTGRIVIVSVPYKWAPDRAPGHRHDPVDEEKLRQWTGREPVATRVVADGAARLIAVYESG